MEERPGQKLFRLLKEAKGTMVPVSNLAAVSGIPADDCITILERLVQGYGVAGRYMRNGDKHEMHYCVGEKK